MSHEWLIATSEPAEAEGQASGHRRGQYTPAILASLAGVSTAVIRRWQRRGLLVPVRIERRVAYFDFSDALRARRLSGWLNACSRPLAVERALAEWLRRHELPVSVFDMADVRIDGPHVLVRLQQRWIDARGQQWIDFDTGTTSALATTPDPEASVPEPIILRVPEPTQVAASHPLATAEEWVEWAAEFEEQGDWTRALECYRSALAAQGPRAELCFLLAEALYRQGDLSAARERYYMAIEIDENFVEARANLGCVLAELGETELAIAALQGALQLAPDFPDVHYHLARLLDDQGQSTRSLTHWQHFLRLAPESPWADWARQRLQCRGDSP